MTMALSKLEECLTAWDQYGKQEVQNSMMAKHIEGTAVSNVTQNLSFAGPPATQLSAFTVQYTDTTIVITLTPT